MPLNSKERRELAARGQQLKAQFAITGDDLSANAVAHVRNAFAGQELLKVRVQTDDRAVLEAAAHRLAAEVPCELITRVGRVLLLYRPREEAS